MMESSTLLIKDSVLSESTAVYDSGLALVGSTMLMTDCIVRDTVASYSLGPLAFSADSSVHIVRTRLQNNRADAGLAGCLYVRASTVTVENSDIIDCSAGLAAPVFFGRAGGHMIFIDSRIVGSSAEDASQVYRGNVGYIDATSSVRVAGGTIMNASGPDQFAILDESLVDFGLILDSVIVDETVNIFSNGSKVLLQNCEGFSSTTVAKAEIATCASASDYCLRTACVDTSAGIDCICKVDGAETPFPTNCMESAVIEVLLPSTHTLTYLINKPFNESAEVLLANVRINQLCRVVQICSLPFVCAFVDIPVS